MAETVIDVFYQFFDRLGYLHPIHAPLTHFPVAGVVFGLILAILALLRHSSNMTRAARYSLILAFIFTIPTIITGYTDWQYFYAGTWLFEIKAKLGLTAVLLILLIIMLYIGRKKAVDSGKSIMLYVLSFLIVSALGYFGGNLVFARQLIDVPPQYKAGQKVFQARCAVCHPHGGNIFNAKFPLRGSPELRDSQTFINYLRNPALPDGSRGSMPAYPPSVLSDSQVEQLYEYITQVLLKERNS